MTEDGLLLEAYARRGDVGSLAALVDRHTKWLYAFVRGLTASDADAEDVYQDVWMRVIRSCESYRGGSMRGYLATIARSAAIDRHRRAGRSTVSIDETDGEGTAQIAELADDGPLPDEWCERKSTGAALRRALRALPREHREVVLMRIEAQLPFK